MEKKKNILLLKAISRYGSVDNYIDKIAEAMRKLGCNTCVLDVYSLASPMRYNYVISSYKFDVVIDINCILYEYGVPGNLPEDVIYCSYLCDPPMPMNLQLKMADDRTVIFNCDNDFRAYMEKFYSNIKHAEFMPLSGGAYPVCIPYKDRTIDIIFTGTYENPEKIRKRALAGFKKGELLAEFCEDMLADIISNPHHTLEESLSVVLKKYNQDISAPEFDELIRKFMDVHWYARSYFREELIRTLLDEGLEIHVYGNGWNEFRSPHKEKLIMHDGGPYAARKALANAKIALNIMPWFKDGFQERIASAMLSKAVAVTDESKYINANFEDGKELVIYSLKDIHALAKNIRHLLAHPKEAMEIAENGYEKAQSHTWRQRTYDMLQKMEKDFGVSFIREEEGKRLDFEIGYPDRRTILLDAVYELKKMADFAVDDIGKIEKLSKVDIECIMDRYEHFQSQFAEHLGELKMNRRIWDYLHCQEDNTPKYAIELFSMQCNAWMNKLLMNISGLDSVKFQIW